MPKRIHSVRNVAQPELFTDSTILYLDNHLLVVNKPAGVLVQGDASGDLDLLSAGKLFVKQRFNKPGNVFLGLVHRLDRPVSGVMVFARTSKAASRLSNQFRARTVVKKYLAMVKGTMSGEGTLVNYVRKDHRTVRVVDENHPKGLRAELSYRVVKNVKDRSIVLVKLATGRPHQIRVQLACIGHPIIGDFKYGAKEELDGRNLALHSGLLEIEHPTKNERMNWSTSVPNSWEGWFSGGIDAAESTFL